MFGNWLRLPGLCRRKRFIGPRILAPGLGSRAMRDTAYDTRWHHFGGDSGPRRADNARGFVNHGFGFADAQRALRAARGF
jgi:hypothetical protein